MKHVAKLSLLMLLAVSVMLAGCGSKGSDESSANGSANNGSKEVKTVKIFQFKVEIAEALNRLKGEFEKEHPNIKLDIQTVGGGADYGAALKAKFASNDAPDIFNNGGFQEMETWMEHLEDLSAEPWVKDVIPLAKEPMTKEGKLYGQPMNLEGYGFIYNKDLFAKAGITELPKTLTQLEDAAKKLQAAGITPFSNGYQEWWILGIHNLNVAFAQQQDPNAFIKGLNDGSTKITGSKEFENWSNMLDLTVKYGNKNPLTTDYNTQVTLFAKGETAMMQQGNWTQVQIDGINKDLNLGVLPMPIDNDAAKNDKLLVGVPNNWVVNKNSKVKEEAKTFLNWMVSSDIGKQYIAKEFKFIPAFSTIPATAEDLGDIAAEVTKYSQDNKVLSWNWFKYPDGVTQEFGNSIQAYIAGKTDKAKLLEDFQKAWDNLKKK
ncbi:ABC transporter substrate-binding protein [Paenibacillus sp. ACRRX]|uniref:ABC transporter substrate-binding protein n=1 Tax=unclassified Paenibacillus TaxID=185978 RepID=UPI001EF564EA|nr:MULTISPECIES: ABC transporter substrate-binding protein [unclassified Paenibacillus]MCG7408641.1 ABC transporter substrate-binding protein [Paenibacillus sp. ACRRX]MDK8182886.1 ABC transporter substrate-binding protein [Paenibacillus sp. UMB4589-SE434]